MILTKLFKVEIFRLNLKNASDIKTIFPQNTKKLAKYVRKKYSMRFYLFCSGDLVTRRGDRAIRPVYLRDSWIIRKRWHR